MSSQTPCGKVRYDSELAAQMALASTGRSPARRRQETRYYQCNKPTCRNGWHLASTPNADPEVYRNQGRNRL